MQHNKFKNVFSLGDAAGTPAAKTAAAIFAQAPAVVHNMINHVKKGDHEAKYDGYSSCPLFVGGKKLMMAEFKYDGVPKESFFSNQTVPRRIFYNMKKEMFPYCYFTFIPKGRWYGSKVFFQPQY